MSKEEIKLEINKVLDQLPDNTLVEILSFLKKNVEKEQVFSITDQALLERILFEDEDLLEKLAK